MKSGLAIKSFLSGTLFRRLLPGVVLVALASPLASAQPLNDSFANRTPITAANSTLAGSLANATFETGEPYLEGVSSGQTAW